MYYVIIPNSQDLQHHGILGMKWGIRRYQPYPKGYSGSGKEVGAAKRSSRSTKRLAKKDAKEYARAKMFYGEGAGVRRRLINNTVKQRSKDPFYKQEFETNLEKQDMAKAASKARFDRKTSDIKSGVSKTARGFVNIAKGNMAYASSFAVGSYFIGKTILKNKDVILNSVDKAKESILRSELERKIKKWAI